MPYLPFVSDENLIAETKKVIDVTVLALNKSDEKVFSNVVDPFSAIFDSSIQSATLDSWLKSERIRQIQKTLQNAVGVFHQNIIGSMDGWQSLPVGGVIDVVNEKKKIIADIKNKFNTTNSGSADALYKKLSKEIKNKYKGYTAYHVQVVPRSKLPYDKLFAPPGNPKTKNIRLISGQLFYEMASGKKDAIKLLYESLPIVLAQIQKKDLKFITSGSLFSELFIKVYGKNL